MSRSRQTVLRIVSAALLALSLAATSFSAPPARASAARMSQEAFFDGRVVRFTPERSLFHRDFKLGPWNLGTRRNDKARDKDPNFYVVVPGTQHVAAGYEKYSHNRVVSLLPLSDDLCNWDVYWAIVLDPTLEIDFRSEKELLVATQEEFLPDSNFKLEQLASYPVLREYLKIRTLTDMAKYRRANGSFPAVLIVPTGFRMRASAVDPGAIESAGRETPASETR